MTGVQTCALPICLRFMGHLDFVFACLASFLLGIVEDGSRNEWIIGIVDDVGEVRGVDLRMVVFGRAGGFLFACEGADGQECEEGRGNGEAVGERMFFHKDVNCGASYAGNLHEPP